MMRALIVDVETTDKDPKTCQVVELAYKPFSILEGFVNERGKCYIYGHSSDMKWGALSTHHILPEELQGVPTFKVPPFNLEDWDMLIGHNIDFDWACLGKPAIKRVCTLAMARALWPECDSHSLGALTYFTQGASKETKEKLQNAHSAEADVNLCEELLRVIITEKGIGTLEELHTFSEEARIPTMMTFGKFKGEKIDAVDRGYANWYRRQPDPDPYLLEAFKRNRLL